MVSIDDFADAILKEIASYTEEVDQVMQDEIEVLTDEIHYDLSNDPNIPNRTGKYAKGFYKKKSAQGKGYKRNKIANKKYRLTHLLESGHLLPDGVNRTREFPHWRQAQQKSEELDKRIIERIKK